MKINTLKRTIAALVLGLIALLGTSEIANAQIKAKKQPGQQKVTKQEREAQKSLVKMEDTKIKLAQSQEQTRFRNMPAQNVNSENNKYRVLRNGNYYETDSRGADFLKHAVNLGYQEGYRAGRDDRFDQMISGYSNSGVYLKGTYGFQKYVDKNQYKYYFRQGFGRGYDDGFKNSYDNGTNDNGSVNILATILQTILPFEKL
jgi:hypothetical protein